MRPLHKAYGERKMSVIFQIFPKNKDNSKVLTAILGKNWEIQAIFIRHIFSYKRSRYNYLNKIYRINCIFQWQTTPYFHNILFGYR